MAVNRPSSPILRTMTRRRFLTLSAAAATGLMAASVGLQGKNAWWLTPATDVYYDRTLIRELPDAAVGELPSEVAESLMAATVIVTAAPIELGHYREFFCVASRQPEGISRPVRAVPFTRNSGSAVDMRPGVCRVPTGRTEGYRRDADSGGGDGQPDPQTSKLCDGRGMGNDCTH